MPRQLNTADRDPPGDVPVVSHGKQQSARDALWPIDVRWRELRQGRSLRIVHRVRLAQWPADVVGLVQSVNLSAYAREYKVTFADGTICYAIGATLLAWASGARPSLPQIDGSVWEQDEQSVCDWSEAVEGIRRAFGRLVQVNAVDASVAEDMIRRLHVALATLPTSPLPIWRP